MYVAVVDGQLVHAESYDSGPPICPECEKPMFYKDGDELAAHFSHYPESSCSYESDRHVQMKWHAAQKAEQKWEADIHVDDRYVGRYKPDVVVEDIACIELVVTNEGDRSAKAETYAEEGYRTLYIYDGSKEGVRDWFTHWADIGHAEWCEQSA